jgi:carboxyl-terminal processing protease
VEEYVPVSGTARTVFFLAAIAWSVAGRAAEPPGLCGSLGPIHVVSYKGHEAQLFDKAIAIGVASTERPFDTPRAMRVLSECLSAVSADGDVDPTISAALNQIHLVMSPDATSMSAQVDGRAPRTLALNQPPRKLSEKFIRGTLADLGLSKDDRGPVSNALWFLVIESYVRSMGNRWNSYRYADEIKADAARRQGRRFSVGFQPTARDGGVFVAEVFDDGLVAAGLKPGTRIVTIDAKPVTDLSEGDIAKYWLGPRPFQYRLTAQHEDRVFDLTADSVPRRFRTIAWSQHGDLAYIRISRFAVESVVELRRALRGIEQAGLRGLVIDIRSNPGGAATPDLIDCFLKPGQTTMSYREHGSNKEVDLDATVDYHGIPLVIVVDGHSASMAETLTAAIKTHKRGVVLGSRTFGKGVGQTIHEVLDEGALHLIERTYFYPGTRESWDGIGVLPDVIVDLPADQADRVNAFLDDDGLPSLGSGPIDVVLAKAFELLEERH